MVKLSDIQRKWVKAYILSAQDHIPPADQIRGFGLLHAPFTYQLNGILKSDVNVGSLFGPLTNLDSACVEYPLDEDRVVYRGCNYAEMKRFIRGKTFIDFGYSSTSNNREIARKCILDEDVNLGYLPAFLEIEISVDSFVLVVDHIENLDVDGHEDEVIIRRKAAFEIIDQSTVEYNEFNQQFEENWGLNVQKPHKNVECFKLKFVDYLGL